MAAGSVIIGSLSPIRQLTNKNQEGWNDMTLRVSGKNLDIGEALRSQVEARMATALTKYFDGSFKGNVTVTRDGTIYIGDVEVKSVEDFEIMFPQVLKDKEATEAYLRGDRDASYGTVLRVLGIMKKLDVAEVGLVADPELER